jgi:hypothetical protein
MFLTVFRFHITNDQVREVLKRTYPEVANATIRESVTADGTRLVSYLPQAGRKG